MVRQAQQELLAFKALQESKARQAISVLQGPQAHRGRLVCRETQERQALLVQVARLVLQASKEIKGQLVQQALEQRVQLDLQVRLALLVLVEEQQIFKLFFYLTLGQNQLVQKL
jgi:hypothetical protein